MKSPSKILVKIRFSLAVASNIAIIFVIEMLQFEFSEARQKRKCSKAIENLLKVMFNRRQFVRLKMPSDFFKSLKSVDDKATISRTIERRIRIRHIDLGARVCVQTVSPYPEKSSAQIKCAKCQFNTNFIDSISFILCQIWWVIQSLSRIYRKNKRKKKTKTHKFENEKKNSAIIQFFFRVKI